MPGSASSAASSSSATSSSNAQQYQYQAPPQRPRQGHQSRGPSKKVSLNHLLNFSLPPRLPPPASSNKSRRSKGKARSASSLAPFTKERYINANFRFVIKPDTDYRQQLLDPDVPIPWDAIDQVIMTTADPPGCPICLTCPPTAPRMTQCGHIFCYHCMLQYHTLEPYDAKRSSSSSPSPVAAQQRWRTCPICWDAIYEKDLKHVRFWTVPAPLRPLPPGNDGRRLRPPPTRTGDAAADQAAEDAWLMEHDPEFQRVSAGNALGWVDVALMARRAGSVVVVPAAEVGTIGDGPEEVPIAGVDRAELWTAARLVRSSRPYLENVLHADIREIETAIADAKSLARAHPAAAPSAKQEIVFYEQALDKLRSQIAALDSPPSQTKPSRGNSAKSTPASSAPSMAPPSPTLPSSPDHWFYFYQGADGQHVYLDPLDVKVLKASHGSYRHFPPTLTLPVVHVQESTITDDLRRRTKYLGHVPAGCDVTFLQIDWDAAACVPPETLASLAPELAARARDRTDRARAEAKAHWLKGMAGRGGGSGGGGRTASSGFHAGVVDPAEWDPHGHVYRDSPIGGDENDLAWVVANAVGGRGGGAVDEEAAQVAVALAESLQTANAASRPLPTARKGKGKAKEAASFAQVAGAAPGWRVASAASSAAGPKSGWWSENAYQIDLGLDLLDLGRDRARQHDEPVEQEHVEFDHHHEHVDPHEEEYGMLDDRLAGPGTARGNAGGRGGGGRTGGRKKNKPIKIALNAGHRKY
ncbi:hypothetical protein AMAG_11853, partial [Allomyces macrogynus ATCC 38327]